MYPEELVAPMRKELTDHGVKELRSAEAVDAFMNEKSGSAFVVVNSVCGCAAGAARPAVALALKQIKPDHVATVFAGADQEATAKFRSHISDIPPSSPSLYLFKDGELVWVLPRHMIEMRSAQDVANDCAQAFKEHCEAGAKA